MPTIDELIASKPQFGSPIAFGGQQSPQNPFQAGAFDPEIAEILARITQPSQPLSGDTLEDFSLPPASGLFGRPIAFNPSGGSIGQAGTIPPIDPISGPSGGAIAGTVVPGILATIIDALKKGGPAAAAGVAATIGSKVGGAEAGTGAGAGAGAGAGGIGELLATIDPKLTTGGIDLSELGNVKPPIDPSLFGEEAGGLHPSIADLPPSFIAGPIHPSIADLPPSFIAGPTAASQPNIPAPVGNIISEAIGGTGTALGSIAALPPAFIAGPTAAATQGIAAPVGQILTETLGPAISALGSAPSGFGAAIQSLTGATSTVGGLLAAFGAITGVAGVLAAPLMDFLNRGRGERSDIADGFIENLQPLFSGLGLGKIDVGEVGGQGRTQDPKLPLPDHLQQFNGAASAIGGLLPPGQLQKRGPLLRDLLDNNLVKSGATEEQALTIYSSLLPKTWDELVGILPSSAIPLMGGFSGSDEEGTKILKTTLREALTGAANVYIATGRLDAIPTAQIEALVSKAIWDVEAKKAAREKQQQHDADLRAFDPSEDDNEELKRLEALVSDRVREREKDRRDDARDDT